MIEQLSPIFRRNVNKCASCKKRNLPEPIVFAKLCRRTNEYVCNGCYSMTAGGLRVRWSGAD